MLFLGTKHSFPLQPCFSASFPGKGKIFCNQNFTGIFAINKNLDKETAVFVFFSDWTNVNFSGVFEQFSQTAFCFLSKHQFSLTSWLSEFWRINANKTKSLFAKKDRVAIDNVQLRKIDNKCIGWKNKQHQKERKKKCYSSHFFLPEMSG